MPLAERSGLIVPVGRWVLREALARCAHWRAATGRPAWVSIDFSARQLIEEDLVRDVAGALASAGLRGSALVVELTESLVAGDMEGTAGGSRRCSGAAGSTSRGRRPSWSA